MSTDEDTLLAARFAALAPEPLAGDWENVLDRAGRAPKGGRRLADPLPRRRRVLVLALVALVVVVGAASALAVRAVLDQGIVGLAPEGATPSTPKSGELLLGFSFGHTMGDPGFFSLSVYADGRVIWRRVGGYSGTDEYGNGTGVLERRLTPAGIDRVLAEVRSSGLVDENLDLRGGVEGLYFGGIDFRGGDRVVHVIWRDPIDPYWDAAKTPTREQARALIRLDARLADLASPLPASSSWLPASAWADAETRAYVPSAYSVCYRGGIEVGQSAVLALLPPSAEDLLRAQESTPGAFTDLRGLTHSYWCSELTSEEARALERTLDDAGVPGVKDVYGLHFGAPDPLAATEFWVKFDPVFPDQG